MAKGINKVILIGNLGSDPEVRYTPTGSAITNITLATSDIWRDKQNGEMQERTEWHRVVFFNRLAEVAGQYLRKGSKIYMEGSLRTRKWVDKNNVERYTTEIIASDLHMLDGKTNSNQNYNQATSEPVNNMNNANQYNNFDNSHNSQFPDLGSEPAILDDDIPF